MSFCQIKGTQNTVPPTSHKKYFKHILFGDFLPGFEGRMMGWGVFYCPRSHHGAHSAVYVVPLVSPGCTWERTNNPGCYWFLYYNLTRSVCRWYVPTHHRLIYRCVFFHNTEWQLKLYELHLFTYCIIPIFNFKFVNVKLGY